MTMHTILVTGACGQLGRELQIVSRNSKDSFIFTDVVQDDEVGAVYLDMTDTASVAALVGSEGVDVIVNCAAYTNVDAAEDNPVLAEKLNCTAVEGLAKVAADAGAFLVHISTDYVFGGETFSSPIPETCAPSPLGVYGRSKLAGEEAVMRSGCEFAIIRTAWLYSEFCRNFLKTMLTLFDTRGSVSVVDDQRGTPTYAYDLAELIMKVIENPRTGIFHFTDEGECSWYGFASAIALMSGSSCAVVPCTSEEYPTKARRPAYSVLSKDKVKSVFGVAVPEWEKSLEVCLKRMGLI